MQKRFIVGPVIALAGASCAIGFAQTTSGTLTGVVKDPTGAVVAGATVTATNPVSGTTRTTMTDAAGVYTITNLPANRYHVTASSTGFKSAAQDVVLRTALAATENFTLAVGTSGTVITVESDDMVSGDAVSSNAVDRDLFSKLPLESTSAPLSSLVSQSTPGIAADSNGLFHPMGEHADTTFALDGQSISDQQSRVFGNQPSTNIIQSINVINGIAPPEYGDKASLVVETTTRSGLGLLKPTGNLDVNYGTFGTTSVAAALGFGTAKFGDFLSVDVVNTGRYLDTPEFYPTHAHGNNVNVFERFDLKPSDADSLQLNLSFSRSWFQQPNQYDQVTQDQRAQIFSFNIAPSWTHTLNSKSLFTLQPFLRQDNFHYYPSNDIFDDTPVTLAQTRRLQQAGGRGDYLVTKGVHTLKFGITGSRTALSEAFSLGVTDPGFNAPCLDGSGAPVTDPTITGPTQCGTQGYTANDGYLPGLAPFDLTRGGSLFHFTGTAPIYEEAAYVSDTIAWRNWTFLLGGRFDNYDGLSSRSKASPRLGASYRINKTNTVLRLGYGQFMLSPYNENLLVSSSTGLGGLESSAADSVQGVALKPAARRQYTAGFEQGLGKYLVVNGEYFWKYTDRDFDFDVVLNTPLAFPIQWQQSKIDGFGIRITVPYYKGFSAFSSLGHSRSRFFGPEVGGVLSNDPGVNTASVFRIDHDQAFEQSTHVQYQYKRGPWTGVTWHYESGLVAGAGRGDLLGLTADQQVALRLTCNGVAATYAAPITACDANGLNTPVLRLPADGTEDDDRNPNRVAPRTLFDAAAGYDNVFKKERLKTNLSVVATNLTNKYAVYNFLSTFSGTHFVSPRTISGKVSFTF